MVSIATIGAGLQAWANDLQGLRRRSPDEEWLDAPGLTQAELAGNLSEISATNRLLGWTGLTLRYVEWFTARHPRRQPLSLLDVATGAGDVPLAIVAWAHRRHQPVVITAADLNPQVLAVARRACRGHQEITLQQADARALPFDNGSFDVVLCSLALHHFGPDDAIVVLRELARVARRGILVPDLERSTLGYLGARALALLWRSPLTRHDGPLSVRRSYTAAEAHDLLRRAGLSTARVARHFPCRMMLWHVC